MKLFTLAFLVFVNAATLVAAFEGFFGNMFNQQQQQQQRPRGHSPEMWQHQSEAGMHFSLVKYPTMSGGTKSSIASSDMLRLLMPIDTCLRDQP